MGLRYRSGSFSKLDWQPEQQNQYAWSRYCAVCCDVVGSTVMPQTGSVTKTTAVDSTKATAGPRFLRAATSSAIVSTPPSPWMHPPPSPTPAPTPPTAASPTPPLLPTSP